MVKMRLWVPFIGPCTAQATQHALKGYRVYLAQRQGQPISVDLININQLTFDQKQKQSFLPDAEDQVRQFFELTTATQPCQVKPVSIHEQRSFCMQFQGNKMQNHVFYLTPFIALEMSDKEEEAIDTIFCPPSICIPDPKKSKNIIFSPQGSRNIQIDVAQPVRASKYLKCHFKSN